MSRESKKKHRVTSFSVDDLSFCPICGCILPLPGLSDSIRCKLCNFQQNTAVYEGVVEYSFKRFAERKEQQKLVQKGDGPLVERKCDKCGSEQMTYTTQQTRSVDEGQTVFFTCPNCQYANITPTSHAPRS